MIIFSSFFKPFWIDLYVLLYTGDLIPGSSGHTLLSSLSSNLFDAQSSIRTAARNTELYVGSVVIKKHDT